MLNWFTSLALLQGQVGGMHSTLKDRKFILILLMQPCVRRKRNPEFWLLKNASHSFFEKWRDIWNK